jgi:hypothetical protein
MLSEYLDGGHWSETKKQKKDPTLNFEFCVIFLLNVLFLDILL